MIILPPQAEFCDCVYDFILHMIDKKPDHTYTSLCENNQQERCQLSECDVVKKFRLPLKENHLNQQIIPSIDESLVDAPISLYPTNDQTTSHRLPSYIPRHPPVYHNPHATYDNNDDDPNGSSFADTQVIIIQPQQLSSSSPRSYFVVRKRTRKGKKKNSKHFAQNNPSFPYNGPHW
jgi:hypothetical protein